MRDATNGETPEATTVRPKKPRKSVAKLSGLTPKHLYFCKRYVLNGRNASKAARESQFEVSYAITDLMNDPMIQAEIARYTEERSKKFDVTADRIITELARVAFGNLADFIELAPDGTPIIKVEDSGIDEMAALSEITQDVYYEKTGEYDEDGTAIVQPVKRTKFKMHAKVAALDQLARILGLGNGTNNGLGETGEEKAAKIRAVLLAMRKADGHTGTTA